MSDFYKWLIIGWSIVVVGIASLGAILIKKCGGVKKVEKYDATLCLIVTFFCWLMPIVAFSILLRTTKP